MLGSYMQLTEMAGIACKYYMWENMYRAVWQPIYQCSSITRITLRLRTILYALVGIPNINGVCQKGEYIIIHITGAFFRFCRQ